MMGVPSAVLMAAVFALAGGCAPIGKMTHDMEPLIRSATTKADHEALAAHYEAEAKALEANAAEHERWAQAYGTRMDSPRVKLNLAQHGRSLAARYREAAAENLDLAREHHQLADAAPK